MTESGPGAPGRQDPETLAHGASGAAGSQPGMVGQVVGGRYRLIRLLGEGAMGAVYLGEHLKIGRKDAIKILRGGLANDKESIARFNRGARNMSAIRHTNVCTLYDYGETDDGSPFLALELISGESLKELIAREQALDLPLAFNLASQTAYALDAAHDAGIVHRDLKPANIMLEPGRDGSYIVKVVDFDIAKGPEAAAGDEVTRLGYVVGTPEYMSPEQLTGERLDGRSDVYSLGIVLFRMLTGQLPFQGGDTQKIMIQRLTEDPLTLAAARPDLAFPPGLQPILDRTLARDRGARYTRAGDLARDLAGVLLPLARPAAGESVPETRLSPQHSPAPAPNATVAAPARTGARPWLIGTAALAVIAIAVAAFMMRGTGAAGDSDDLTQPLQLGGGGTDPDPAPPIVVDSGNSGRGGGGGAPAESIAPQPPRPEPEPPPRLPTGPRVGLAVAVDVLLNQLDLIAVDPDDIGITRNMAIARAVRDTAEAYWELAGLPTQQRATAASLVGTAQLALGDGAACALWFNRALELQPANDSWRLMLDNNCPRARE